MRYVVCSERVGPGVVDVGHVWATLREIVNRKVGRRPNTWQGGRAYQWRRWVDMLMTANEAIAELTMIAMDAIQRCSAKLFLWEALKE